VPVLELMLYAIAQVHVGVGTLQVRLIAGSLIGRSVRFVLLEL
jgi:hypothetical protein